MPRSPTILLHGQSGGLSLLDLVLVSPETQCWLWSGRRDRDGYAVASTPLRPGATQVHRYVYEHLERPVPDGLELDHVCRTRHCVNPDHLEPVTHAENLRRSIIARYGYDPMIQCAGGHPWTEANTYLYRGRRECRICRLESTHAYRRRRDEPN